MEYEVDSLARFEKDIRGSTSQPELENIMKGYMDLVEGGRREIYLIE